MAGLEREVNNVSQDSYIPSLVERRAAVLLGVLRERPYEVRLSDFVRVTNLDSSEIRFHADKGGVLRRWPDSENPIYLIERKDDEQILGINNENYTSEFVFKGYFSNDWEENKSLIFGNVNREYAYYMPLDILAGRLGMDKKLVQARLKKLGFVADIGCEFTSRDEEMIFLYTEPEKYLPKKIEKEVRIKCPEPKKPSKTEEVKEQEKSEIKKGDLILLDLPKGNIPKEFRFLEKGKKLSKEELDSLDKELEKERPKTRADCKYGERPCLWFGCRYNLVLNIDVKKGKIRLENPRVGLYERKETCVLDVIDRRRSDLTLEEVGDILNLTRERVRQIEAQGIGKLRKAKRAKMLEPVSKDYLEMERKETLMKRGLGASR